MLTIDPKIKKKTKKDPVPLAARLSCQETFHTTAKKC